MGIIEDKKVDRLHGEFVDPDHFCEQYLKDQAEGKFIQHGRSL